MIKKLIIFIFVFALFHLWPLFLFAQVETLYPICSNPILAEQVANQQISQQRRFQKTYFLADTLVLPFLDDFSSNKLGKYDISKYPASSLTQYTFHNFKKNGVLTDSTYYSLDTTYWQSYDLSQRKKVFIPKASFTIDFFSYPGLGPPFTSADSTKQAWPEYFEVNFDTITGNSLDSFQVVSPILRLDTFYVDVYNMASLGANWLDADVYLNNDFPIGQITVGVATFDGLDSAGRAYRFVPSDSYGNADYLTSKPIKLKTPNGAADSVYFTFYYEAQGIGNWPQLKDSLILEFRSPIYRTWDIVWQTPGPDRDISSTCSFSFVNIPIRDTNYLQNGFQFRFRNKATLSGNFDHWHIDYVKLDKGRFNNDNKSVDVAFINDQQSLLNGLSATTWKQYDPSMMRTEMNNIIVNLQTTTANTQISYAVRDNYGSLIYQSTPTSDNLGTGINNCQIIASCPEFKNPTVNFTYSDSDLCKTYTIKHALRTSPDVIRTNDTITFLQHISNYMAYDDGTAENGYGLLIPNGQAAYRFKLINPDVITAVRFYFNPLLNDVSSKEFYIKIWGDAGGVPGSVIYTSPRTYSPVYSYTYNGFVEYAIDPTSLESGYFYVGWQQISNDKLNIGFDKNTNNYTNIFKYIDGQGWSETQFDGSLMIRPVFGTCPFETIGIKKYQEKEQFIKVFPNPSTGIFQVFFSDGLNIKHSIQVVDVTGKEVLNATITSGEMIDLSNLSDGVYMLKSISEKSNLHYQKIVKQSGIGN